MTQFYFKSGTLPTKLSYRNIQLHMRKNEIYYTRLKKKSLYVFFSANSAFHVQESYKQCGNSACQDDYNL